MKTLFIVLVSSVVLAGCVKPQGATIDAEKMEPLGLKDFCEAKNAVLVVYVKKNGKPQIKECPEINFYRELPANVNEKQPDTFFTLGKTQKWIERGNKADPCIEWKVDGYPFYYCW